MHGAYYLPHRRLGWPQYSQHSTPHTPQLLCGEHSRATGACYGEQSRRAKSLKGKGIKGKGKAAQAAKRGHAGASKRVVKRKEW